MHRFGTALALMVMVGAGRAEWTPTTGIPTGAYLEKVVIGKTHLFAATFIGAYRSADEGATWSPMVNGIPEAPVRGMGVVEDRVFAATDSGLFVSTDDGGTWTKSTTWTNGYKPLNVLVHGSDIYVSTAGRSVSSGNGVYRSKDRGQTWIPANQGADIRTFTLESIGNVLLIGSSGITYRSTDFGAKWVPSPTGATRDIVTGFAARGNLVFAGTYQDGVFQSSDSGLTWKSSGAVLSVTVRCMAAVGSVVFAGTGNGVEMSTNEGRTWSTFNQGYTSRDVNGIGMGRTHLFVGNAGPVFRRPLSELPSSIVRRETPKTSWAFQGGVPLLGDFDLRGRRLLPAAQVKPAPIRP